MRRFLTLTGEQAKIMDLGIASLADVRESDEIPEGLVWGDIGVESVIFSISDDFFCLLQYDGSPLLGDGVAFSFDVFCQLDVSKIKEHVEGRLRSLSEKQEVVKTSCDKAYETLSFLKGKNPINNEAVKKAEQDMQDRDSGLLEISELIESLRRFVDVVDVVNGVTNHNSHGFLLKELFRLEGLQLKFTLGAGETCYSDFKQCWVLDNFDLDEAKLVRLYALEEACRLVSVSQDLVDRERLLKTQTELMQALRMNGGVFSTRQMFDLTEWLHQQESVDQVFARQLQRRCRRCGLRPGPEITVEACIAPNDNSGVDVKIKFDYAVNEKQELPEMSLFSKRQRAKSLSNLGSLPIKIQSSGSSESRDSNSPSDESRDSSSPSDLLQVGFHSWSKPFTIDRFFDFWKNDLLSVLVSQRRITVTPRRQSAPARFHEECQPGF